MSDDLEDDGPPSPPESAPTVTAPVAAPVAPVPPPDDETPADVETVEVGGQKLVPVAALIGERKQRQALAEKAARTDELETYVREAKPYVDFLRANPDLLKPRQAAAAPSEASEAPTDPASEALAKTLDLYTPEGKPDLARAQMIRTMVSDTARAEAQQMIGPIHERTYQEQSARNFQIALSFKDPDGRSPSQASLATIWRTMPAAQTADPQVASILTLTALGMDSVSRKPSPSPPGQPPVVTEGVGGAGRRPTLSALETAVARDRGVSESTWQEHTKGFVKGRPVTLEDD